MNTLKIGNRVGSLYTRRVSRNLMKSLMGLVVCSMVAIGGAALAQHASKGEVKVTRLSQRDVIEKIDGMAASVTMEEVNFDPGQKDLAHRHTGAVFGYVLEGEYEHALNDGPIETYKAGDTFYEPSGSLHRIARIPSPTTKTRLLAVFLHARDTKVTTVQVKEDHK